MKATIAALLLSVGFTHGAAWYVDSGASGANNGTSWVNAWTNTTAIVWASVSAGDTVYISGGTTTKSYAGFSFGKSGTSGNLITVRVGQDAGHNGLAIITNTSSLNGHQWVVIDGSRSDAFSAPTSVLGLPGNITNNIGIRFEMTFPGTTTQGIFVGGASAQNNIIRWVEIGPISIDTDDDTYDGFGIRFLNVTAMTNFLVEYCYIHDIRNDGINLNDITGTEPTFYDACRIRWTYIGRTGDDGIQWTENGLSLVNCFLDDHKLGIYHGHPDQLQFSGVSQGYFKIINNVLRNKGNSLIIGEHRIEEGGTLGPMIVAGNIFYNTRDWFYTTNSAQAYGVTFSAWRPNADVSVTQGFWTNFHYLHNTMYYQTTVPFAVGRAAPSGGTRSVWDLRISDSSARNNLHVDNKWNSVGVIGNFALSGSGLVGDGTNGIYYSTNDFPMTHNVVAGANKSGIYFTNAFSNFASFGMGNSSSVPSVETNAYSFALASDDGVARNAAFDVSSMTNQFPELMTDIAGNLRFADGSPDIGALEYTPTEPELVDGVTSGLALWLRFNDSLSDGLAEDSSATGNTGLHFGYSAGATGTNRFPVSQSWTNPATLSTNTAASFSQYADGWSTYGFSSDYVVITNRGSSWNLQSLSNATVLMWVWRDEAPIDKDSDTQFEWNEDQSRYISAGYAYRGAWTVGMFSDRGQQYSFVRVYTNDHASADQYVSFGALNAGNPTLVDTSGTGQGKFVSGQWVHMGFTWTNQTLTTFTNGVSASSATFATVTNLTIRGPSGSLLTGSMMLGCDTHNGLPWLTPTDDSGDQYPNHAFFAGDMDDVRIYNRALNSAEVAAIYNGTNYISAPAEAGGASASTTIRRMTAQTLRIR